MSYPLQVNQLTKTYAPSVGIEAMTFEARSGEILGLLGPNGAGKTTTIRTIATMIAPTSGTASVAGFDIQTQATQVLQNLGVLTTDTGIYDRFTGLENLYYFGHLYGLKGSILANRILELQHLLDMSSFISKKAGAYSTGMKQKLAVARSIIHNPPVMLLDEPTTGLDVLAAQSVLNFMRYSKQAGKCILFSTHNMLDADQLCDRIAIMHQGKILIIDTPTNIKRKTNKDNLANAFLDIIKQNSQDYVHIATRATAKT